jgi:hypothetical protein
MAYVVNPQHAEELVTRPSHWARLPARPIAIIVAGTLGIWLLIRGLVHLVG